MYPSRQVLDFRFLFLSMSDIFKDDAKLQGKSPNDEINEQLSSIRNRIDHLSTENAILRDELSRMLKENQTFRDENQTLRDEIQDLREENRKIHARVEMNQSLFAPTTGKSKTSVSYRSTMPFFTRNRTYYFGDCRQYYHSVLVKLDLKSFFHDSL